MSSLLPFVAAPCSSRCPRCCCNGNNRCFVCSPKPPADRTGFGFCRRPRREDSWSDGKAPAPRGVGRVPAHLGEAPGHRPQRRIVNPAPYSYLFIHDVKRYIYILTLKKYIPNYSSPELFESDTPHALRRAVAGALPRRSGLIGINGLQGSCGRPSCGSGRRGCQRLRGPAARPACGLARRSASWPGRRPWLRPMMLSGHDA